MVLGLLITVDDLFYVPLHGESFTSAGWTIDKDSAPLPVQECVAQGLSVDFIEDFLLSRIRLQHLLKRVNLLLSLSCAVDLADHDLCFVIVNHAVVNNLNASRIVVLARNGRSKSRDDIDRHVCFVLARNFV